MRGYKINIKSAYLLFSVEHKFTFPFDFFFPCSNSWKFRCDHFIITVDETSLADGILIIHLKCFLIL